MFCSGRAIFLEYVVLVALGFFTFVLIYEEPALTRKMGAAYEQYCEEVPRWIPRFWGKTGESCGLIL